jgi:hypothetical protein
MNKYSCTGSDMKINGLTLVQTCIACPEQYDVFKGDKQVAYMRLRGGVFSVEVPDACGEEVLRACPKGGGGMFEFNERMLWLREGVKAIKKHMRRGEAR